MTYSLGTQVEFMNRYHDAQEELNDALRFFNRIADSDDLHTFEQAKNAHFTPCMYNPRTEVAKQAVKVYDEYAEAYKSVSEMFVVEPTLPMAELAVRHVDAHFFFTYLKACAFRAFLVTNVTDASFSWINILTEGCELADIV